MSTSSHSSHLSQKQGILYNKEGVTITKGIANRREAIKFLLRKPHRSPWSIGNPSGNEDTSGNEYTEAFNCLREVFTPNVTLGEIAKLYGWKIK